MTVTAREALVAEELLRLAREVPGLEAAAPPALDEPLAGRLDSMALLALVVAVEDRFHVILADDDAAGARTLGDLARLVAARAPEDRLPAVAEGRGP